MLTLAPPIEVHLEFGFGEPDFQCMHPVAQHSRLTQLHLTRRPFVGNFFRNHLPTNHKFSKFARVIAVKSYSSEIQNYQWVIYVHREITYQTPLGSVSCRFMSISDRTGTLVGTCMHTRLHVYF